MFTIQQTHWCPRCRVTQDNWRVPNVNKNLQLKVGAKWPEDIEFQSEVYDQCQSCRKEMKGKVLLNEGVVVYVREEEA